MRRKEEVASVVVVVVAAAAATVQMMKTMQTSKTFEAPLALQTNRSAPCRKLRSKLPLQCVAVLARLPLLQAPREGRV